jgi:hypothetical protein
MNGGNSDTPVPEARNEVSPAAAALGKLENDASPRGATPFLLHDTV